MGAMETMRRLEEAWLPKNLVRAGMYAKNTIDARPWTIWMARWFGQREEFADGTGHLITASRWRGKTYFLSSANEK